MAKKTLDQCHSGRDFLNYATAHGATIRNGKGSHMIVCHGSARVPVPMHTGDLGTGLRCKLVKLFAAMGLVLLLAVIVI